MAEEPLADLFKKLTGLDVERIFRTLEGRIVFQKVIYFLQTTGAISPKGSFSMYIHGPYSSAWAKEGFAVVAGESPKVDVVGDISKTAHLIVGKNSVQLQALADVYYLHLQGKSDTEIREAISGRGHLFLLPYLEWARSELRKAGIIS